MDQVEERRPVERKRALLRSSSMSTPQEALALAVVSWDGDDGWSREMCIETHICTSVQLGSLNCVRVGEKDRRGPSGEGGLSRSFSRPKFLGPRRSKTEGC